MDCIKYGFLKKPIKGLLVALSLIGLNQANALGSFPKQTDLTIGVASLDQGKVQDVNVFGLVRDRYTVSKDHDD
jgi:hypothetical protein